MVDIILIFVVVVGIAAPSIGCFLLWDKNNVLKTDVERITSEWQHLDSKYEDLADQHEDQQIELGGVQAALSGAVFDRDSALKVLESKLIETFTSPAPDCIMTEVGRDGVHYEFKWDPPEQAEIHPIQGSKAT